MAEKFASSSAAHVRINEPISVSSGHFVEGSSFGDNANFRTFPVGSRYMRERSSNL